MAYYHVLVKFKDQPEKVLCIFADLSAKELDLKFLQPYRKGQTTLSGSRVVDVNNIILTQIIETEKQSDLELKEIQAKSRNEIEQFNQNSGSVYLLSLGRGYDAEDIAEAGNDVTSNFISAPPGHRNSRVLATVFNNQWVVAVLGGIVVAGIAAWFGWS